MSNLWVIVLSLLAGLYGGFLASHFSYPRAVQTVKLVTVHSKDFEMRDSEGRLRVWLTSCQDLPCLNFYDGQGHVRLQAGVYNDDMPFIGLFDKDFQAQALLRLAGENSAPVLVMKHNGQDRMILGMDLTTGKDPFLTYFDNAGEQHTVFGQYGLTQKAKALSKEDCGHNMVAEQVAKIPGAAGTKKNENGAGGGAVPLNSPGVSSQPELSKTFVH